MVCSVYSFYSPKVILKVSLSVLWNQTRFKSVLSDLKLHFVSLMCFSSFLKLIMWIIGLFVSWVIFNTSLSKEVYGEPCPLVGFKQLLKRIFLVWTDYKSLLKLLSVSTPPTLLLFHSIILSQNILWYRWLSPWTTLEVVAQLKSFYDSIAQWTKNQRYIYILAVLIACNFTPLKLFPFRNFHSTNNHAQPSKNKQNPCS